MKKYEIPEMEVVEFENEDIITGSGCNAVTQEEFEYGGGGNPQNGR